MKAYDEEGVRTVLAESAAAVARGIQLGTIEELRALALGIFHAQLPDIFPAPPPAPQAGTTPEQQTGEGISETGKEEDRG